jgi:protein disulfide-isomerase
MRMIAVSALSALALAGAAPCQEGESAWLTDFEQAKATAAKENKLILADFTGSDWCGWCIKLKDEVFDTSEFKEWAAKKVVLLELDFPRKKQLDPELKKQNTALAKQFGVRGYPTILFLDASGEQVGRLGYKAGGPEVWLKLADEQMAAASKEPAKEPAKTEGGKNDGDKAAQKPAADAWLTSYEDALARAKKERKLILADFTGSDWCGWCIKLKDEVFTTPEFKKWAAKKVVLLELDFPRNKEQSDELREQNRTLAKKFGVRGYPTIVFIDPRGEKIGNVGYVKGGPAEWIKKAEKEMRRD